MTAYASIDDMITLFRPLKPAEKARAEALLPVVSARLRQEAHNRGRDLDGMILADDTETLKETAKSVTVDIVARLLMTPTDSELGALSQYSQSALGYTVSGTFASAGGGIFIKKSELDALGLRRPRMGMVDLAGGTEKDED